MPITRTKVTKRKLEAVHNKVLEPKCSKDGNSKFKILQEKFDLLEQENKKNLEVISRLREEVLLLTNKNLRKTEAKESQTVQVDEDWPELPCKICIYVASCEDELRSHIENEHDSSEEPAVYFTCNICYHKAVTKGELMMHRKKTHPQKIKVCRFFRVGACELPDEICWFSHENKHTDPSFPQTLTQYKCGFCDETFTMKSAFMKHRKKQHIQHVQECREGTWCGRGESCWYKHSDSDQESESENNDKDMIERLFDIMEKYGKRIEIIENIL